MKLDCLVEAVLYFKGEPVLKKELCKILETSDEALKEALKSLSEKMNERGVIVLETEFEVSLGTSPSVAPLIEKIKKEYLEKNLGKAGLETLTIVAYKGPISRNSIDNIRGVNSSFILRNLLVRGLVERVPDEKDQRAFLYRPTIDLLRYLGITKVDELPEYGSIVQSLEKIEADSEKVEML